MNQRASPSRTAQPEPDDTGRPIPAGFVKPSWLRSPDPEKYAAAMMQCQDAQGLCGQLDGSGGRCRQNNWCFASVRARYDRLMSVRDEVSRRIRKLLEDGE